MNFLAHLYLSKDNEQLLIGNFIADAVKGKKYQNYPSDIQKGIMLHRYIDSYTDAHPIVKRSMHRLNARYRHYDGVIIDIFYDHFLAKNWSNYSNTPLNEYAEKIYKFLNTRIDTFPEKIQYMLPFMIEHNWLVTYASIEGIGRILNGMNTRTQGKSKMNFALQDLKEHYTDFERDFTEFFDDLMAYSEEKTTQLQEK
jgi:acyl carrier protein phosphodiesterase